MSNTISTLNPSLANDIVAVTMRANKRCYPNSGQTGTLSTVAMLQMRNAAQPSSSDVRWSVPVSDVVAVTGLSKGTIKGHIKFWVERGVLSVDQGWLDDRYYVNLGA